MKPARRRNQLFGNGPAALMQLKLLMQAPRGATHPGIVAYKGRSDFFYHNGALSEGSSFWRSVCVDYLCYNPETTSRPIPQAITGVAPVQEESRSGSSFFCQALR